MRSIYTPRPLKPPVRAPFKLEYPPCRRILRVSKKIQKVQYFLSWKYEIFTHHSRRLSVSHAQKWSTYVYLEPDTTIGKFEAGITKFIITALPLQFTCCIEMRFFLHCLWNSIVAFIPSNWVLNDTLQNTALRKVQHRIFCSTL